MSLIRFPAAWMRGGTSKGLFVDPADLPADPARRDALLLRAIGSPDPYGTQMDGLGGATSSTSKVALVSRSTRWRWTRRRSTGPTIAATSAPRSACSG